MLEDDTLPTNDDLPRPPSGRRAASRPSGPPKPVTEIPDPKPAAKVAAPQPEPQPEAATPAAVDEEKPTTRRRSTRSTATKTTSTRRRSTRTAASEEPAEQAAPAEAQEPSEQAAPTAETAAETVIAEDATEPTTTEPTTEERAPRRRTRSTGTRSRKATQPALVDEPEAVAEQGEEPETVASDVKPEAETVSEQKAHLVHAGEPEELDAAEPLTVLTAAETEAALADLAAAIAAGESDPETDGESDSAAEDESDDDEDEQPRRRRRRRGGRRRRRGGSSASQEDEDGESDSEGDADAESDSEDDAETTGEETSETDGEGSGTHRRRRRRRRSGEDTGGGEDDPDTEVVVRVREPRGSRAKANDQITGIDGSTRMEAKRQRRREGRAAGRRRAPILSESEFLSRREAVDRVMAIRQKSEYTQIAVLEDGVLVEHYVDRRESTSLIGNIYLGKVQNVLPGMEAAFLDIGRGRNAVLYAGEVDWDGFGDAGRNKKMEEVFKSGQSVVVQVTKDPVGAKGARLTSHISIPGRYVVYAPGGDLSGISRKLPDTERARLKEILDKLSNADESFIVRTAAEGVEEAELQRDVTRLKAQWEAISKKIKSGSAPQLLYSEPDATVRIVRDLFTEDFKELVIAGHGQSDDAWEAISAYVEHVAPHLAERMTHWDEAKGDIFAHHRVDEQIQKALERKVFLPSGGSLVIDRTEAMTVIDVNTGKFTGNGGNLEATVTSNNLEAAEEIVRQLRLRDIGGIIVIDFIDMVLPSNRELLLRRLVECLGRDRTRHQVAEVTSLGLVQMTRKKIGTGLAEAFTQECETCKGRGYHRHAEPIETQAPSDGGDRSERRQHGKESSNSTQRRSKRGGAKKQDKAGE